MFDQIRSKSKDTSARRSSSQTTDGTRRSSDDSNAQHLKVPESQQQQQQQQQQQSTSSEQTSRNSSRGRSPSTTSARRNSVSSDGKPRLRDILWRNGLWDAKGQYPEGPTVKPMSQSVDVTHPEVVEEQMRKAYPQWN